MTLQKAPTVTFLRFGQLPTPAPPALYQVTHINVRRGRHRFDARAGRPVLGHPGREYAAAGPRRHLDKVIAAATLAGAGTVLGLLYLRLL